jgi:hypothetical protein
MYSSGALHGASNGPHHVFALADFRKFSGHMFARLLVCVAQMPHFTNYWHNHTKVGRHAITPHCLLTNAAQSLISRNLTYLTAVGCVIFLESLHLNMSTHSDFNKKMSS